MAEERPVQVFERTPAEVGAVWVFKRLKREQSHPVRAVDAAIPRLRLLSTSVDK